ncbi:efflux RND transporter periplasmic adaptor subunit [Plastoroseomonas arctica]|uniref:Efflux RND transporter periplasmic adaptor subunit n=1 Tax=Plastoroseomonas arctica TaxID=1509237 RepID=A0AAF1JYS4_9PROT|nr:efflux RND transporter periplasmic adaptor subunit [Plastoroseomonas arctica]MBR0656701.1 efflux RND transporter periplasmic adaptor subunit [Plastoroseomonas arctica]
MRIRTLVFGGIALALIGGGAKFYLDHAAALGQAASSAPAPAPAAPRIPVTTEPAQVGSVPIEILANGIVTPEVVVTIRPRVDGQITQVHVREGNLVRRGDRLFTLDSRFNQAILAQQEAQLSRDRALLARAQADAVRYQSLRGEGFAAQQRFEQAQADAAAAAATVRADEALIQQTRLNIEFATIVAEADGRLGALPLQIGSFMRLAENVALGTITRMDPMLVQFSVPERWLPEIQRAMRTNTAMVTARAEAADAVPATGELIFVDSTVDTTTGTITLKARFENADFRLWPGQYVQVSMVPRAEQNALTIPSASLQTGQNGRFIFILTGDGTARRRPMELVRIIGDRAVVRGELAAGERVIVEGAQRVTDGSRAVERTTAPQRVTSLN